MVYKIRTLVSIMISLCILYVLQINTAKLRKASISLGSDESQEDLQIKEMLSKIDQQDEIGMEIEEVNLEYRENSDDKKLLNKNKSIQNSKRKIKKHEKKDKNKHDDIGDKKKHKKDKKETKKETKQIQSKKNKDDKKSNHHKDEGKKNKQSKKDHSQKQTPHTFEAEYDIAYFESCPDGFCREVLGTNGQFPPTIRVKKGDNLDITIKNNVPNKYLDLQWHGLFQKKSLTSDGVGQVNQCSPLFAQKYRYQFSSETQSGTFWYHASSGLGNVDGLRGALIIDDPQDPYLKEGNYIIDKKYSKISGEASKVCKDLFYVDHSKVDTNNEPDSMIFLSDWHHRTAEDLGNFYLSPQSEGAEPTPDSALINNKGNYYCKPPKCESMYNTKIIYGKAKKFRIINASAMAVFHFAIEGHSMYLVESDGVPLDGTTKLKILRLNAGQRVSVIIKANQDPGNYWIRAKMDPNIYPKPPSAEWQSEVFGVLEYAYSYGDNFHNSPPKEENYRSMDSLFEDSMKEAMSGIDMNVPMIPLRQYINYPPTKAERTFILNINSQLGKNNVHLLGFNNILFTEKRDTTLLGLVIDDKDLNQSYIDQTTGLTFGYNPLIYTKGEVVDIIFNNYDQGQHPIHINGHNFFVMYSGPKNSNEFITDVNSVYTFEYNKNAPIRDVATLNGNSVMVIRFIADNPGTWVVHDQIEWHQIAGLRASLVEDKHYTRKLYKNNKSELNYCQTYKEQTYNSLILKSNEHILRLYGNSNSTISQDTVLVKAPPVINGDSLDMTNAKSLVIPPATQSIIETTTNQTNPNAEVPNSINAQIAVPILTSVLQPIIENLATTVTSAVRDQIIRDINIENAQTAEKSNIEKNDVITNPLNSNMQEMSNSNTINTIILPTSSLSPIDSSLDSQNISQTNTELSHDRQYNSQNAHVLSMSNDKTSSFNTGSDTLGSSSINQITSSNNPVLFTEPEIRREVTEDRREIKSEIQREKPKDDRVESVKIIEIIKPQERIVETEKYQEKPERLVDNHIENSQHIVERDHTPQEKVHKLIETEKIQNLSEKSLAQEKTEKSLDIIEKGLEKIEKLIDRTPEKLSIV